MPMETKKILWTVLSVTIALAVASGIALALTYPRGDSPGAPATVAAVSPPRAASPDVYVRAVEPIPVPPPTQAPPPASSGTDIIVIYGDKPSAATLSVSQPSGSVPQATNPAASSAATSIPATVPKTYTPASSTSTSAAKSSTTTGTAAASSAKAASAPVAKSAKPRSVAEYWIQAAAFTSRSRADDLQRDLAGKGLSTLITMKDIDGATWYRVRVGPYTSEAEAKGWLEKIRVISGCGEAYVSKQTVLRSS
jgi:DedD protein